MGRGAGTKVGCGGATVGLCEGMWLTGADVLTLLAAMVVTAWLTVNNKTHIIHSVNHASSFLISVFLLGKLLHAQCCEFIEVNLGLSTEAQIIHFLNCTGYFVLITYLTENQLIKFK